MMNATHFLDDAQQKMTSFIPNVSTGPSLEKMKQTAQDFEAFFISRMFESMYDTVPVNETFGGGAGEKMFRSMLIDEYGKMTARSGGIGVADAVMKEMLAQQAKTSAM